MGPCEIASHPAPITHQKHAFRTQAHRIRVSLHRVLRTWRFRPRRMVRNGRRNALRGNSPSPPSSCQKVHFRRCWQTQYPERRPYGRVQGEYGKMFASNPVIATEPTSNTLDVRLIVNPDGGDEEGKVLGIYAHGVPDFEEWLKLFGESQSDEFLKDFGIVKSYAGNMTDDSSWKKADVVMPMVIHVFKDYNSKAKFDTIFDPTFGMFKDIASAGGVLPPFFEQQLGSVPGKGEGAWIMKPATSPA